MQVTVLRQMLYLLGEVAKLRGHSSSVCVQSSPRLSDLGSRMIDDPLPFQDLVYVNFVCSCQFDQWNIVNSLLQAFIEASSTFGSPETKRVFRKPSK